MTGSPPLLPLVRHLLAAVLTTGLFACRVDTVPLAPLAGANAAVPSAARAAGLHGTIVFHGARNGAFDIFVMKADGSGQTQLTLNDANDFNPVWSQDGRYIAYVSYGPSYSGLMIMHADGSESRPVLPGQSGVLTGNPAWSPDGRLIAFAIRGDVHVIRPDGTGLRRVTRRGTVHGVTAWSPSGRQIAFLDMAHGETEIYTTTLDGDATRLTDHPASDQGDHAGWSPDGRRFLFSSTRDGDDLDIFVMDADGSNVRQLTHNDGVHDDDPVWSPDGKRIAFHSTRDGDEEIYVMNADGSAVRRLTSDADAPWQTFNAVPSWMSGGRGLIP